MRPIAFLAAPAALLLPAIAAAQQAPPAGSFGSTVEVHEVLIEVQATDGQGRQVDDLRAEELRLFQDSAAVEITGLRRVSEAPAAGGAPRAPSVPAAPAAVPADPLSLVVFIDNDHLAPFHRRKALGQLWTFLERNLAPSDRVMVVAYDKGVRVLQPFTSDPKELLQTLRAYEQTALMSLPPDLAEQRTLQQIQEIHQVDAGAQDNPCTISEGLARNFAAERYHEVRLTARALESFVTSLSGLTGRKAVIHLSDGIPLIAGLAPLAQVKELCDGSGLVRGVKYAVEMFSDTQDHVEPQRVQMAMGQFDTSGLWRDVGARANLQGVTFYTVHAAGVEPETGAGADLAIRLSSQEIQTAVQRNRLDPLMVLAEETGGGALLGRNDLGPGLAAMMKDLRDYYALTFRPPTTEAGTVHKLRLESTRPGLDLRYRKSYLFRTRHEQVADRLIAAILHKEAPNAMGLSVEVAAGKAAPEEGRAPGGGGSTRLRLAVPLSRLTLVPGEQEAHGLFTVFVAVLRGDGAVTPVRQATLPVKVPVGRLEEARKHSYHYEVELDLPVGEHFLGLGVLDELEGSSSFLWQSLKV